MRSQRKLIEYPTSIYWNSNEKLSKIEWTSIEHPTNVYRASNEHLSRIDVERIRFLIKHALCGYSELCFLCRRGSIFQKNHRTRATECEKGSKNYVGHVKISPKWCRIHEDVHKIMSNTSLTSSRDATCNNNTHICYVFLRSSLRVMERMKGERPNDRAVGPKHMPLRGRTNDVFY